MNPHQVVEAAKLIENRLRLDGVKDYVNPHEESEHDAVLRSMQSLRLSSYLGRAALLRLDKPHSLNVLQAEWLYIVSYRDEAVPQRPSIASVTLFAEREPIIFRQDNSLPGDVEPILEDLRSIQAE